MGPLRQLAWVLVAVAVVSAPPLARSEAAAARAGLADAGLGAKGGEGPAWSARAEDEALPNVWKVLAGLVHDTREALLGARQRLEQEELWPASLDLAAHGLSRSAAAAVEHVTSLEAHLRRVVGDLGLKFCAAGSACSRTGQLLAGLASSAATRELQASAKALLARGLGLWQLHVIPRARRVLLQLLRATNRAARIAAPLASRAWELLSVVLRRAAEVALPVAKRVAVFLMNCNTLAHKAGGAILRAFRGAAAFVTDSATAADRHWRAVGEKARQARKNRTDPVGRLLNEVESWVASRKNATRTRWESRIRSHSSRVREGACPIAAMFRNFSSPVQRAVSVGRSAAARACTLLKEVAQRERDKIRAAWSRLASAREQLVASLAAKRAGEERAPGGDAQESTYGPAVSEWFITQQEAGAQKDEASRYVVLRHGGGVFLLLSLSSNGWFRHVIASGEEQSSSVLYPSGTIQPADHVGASDLLDMLRDKYPEQAIGKLPRSGRTIGNWQFKSAGDSLVVTNVMHKHEATPPRLVLTGDGFVFSGFSGGVKERRGEKRVDMSREETDAELSTVLGQRA